MIGAKGEGKPDSVERVQEEGEYLPDVPEKVHELHAVEVAMIAGPAVTAQHVLDVRRAEAVAFTYSRRDHMGG
jgi:hypothetical protein